MSAELFDDIDALARIDAATFDRLRERRPDAAARAAMRALTIWRVRRWLATPAGGEKAAFEAMIAGIVDDMEIAALQSEMAAGAGTGRALDEMRAAMDERLSYWIRRALAPAAVAGDSTVDRQDAVDDSSPPAAPPYLDAADVGGAEIIPFTTSDAAPSIATDDDRQALAARAAQAEADVAQIRTALMALAGEGGRASPVAARRGVNAARLTSRFSR